MDNFDRNESTLAGTGSTHDTILVLFQNVPANKEKPLDECVTSTRPFSAQSRTTVKRRSKVMCQQLIRMGAMKERGEIGDNLEVSESVFNPYSTFTERTDPSMSETSATDVSLERESSLVPCNDLNSSAATLEPYIETADEMPNPSLSVVGTGTITRTPTNLSLETTDSVSVNMCKQSMKSIHLDNFLWLVNRLIKKASELGYVVLFFLSGLGTGNGGVKKRL